MTINTIGIIGIGLIGGSIAKTIKKKNLPIEIIAYDSNLSILKNAQEDGVIDKFYDIIDERFKEIDLLFLCAPVEHNNVLLSELKNHISKDCILTDVGSVKELIHIAIQNAELEANFIGGHPMAGSEKSGYFASSDHLFENAYYVLTPCEKVSEQMIHVLYSFIESLGALPLVLDYSRHDYATAAISHIPHIIASSLVNLVASIDEDGLMKQLAAGGFKDLTRIASASPSLWQQITLCNKDKIHQILVKYIELLLDFKYSLEEENRNNILRFFEEANTLRSSITGPSLGLIKKSYEITVDVPDEPGVIAKVATLLGYHNISIKNIGINNSREFEQGVLKILFYDEASQLNSISILKNLNYTVYQR